MKITAYKSTESGKIFEHKEDYDRHLRQLRAERAKQKKIDDAIQARRDFIKHMHETVQTFDELVTFIKNNWRFFAENAVRHDILSAKSANVKKSVVDRLSFSSMRWHPSVSNSHHCPMNGVTNWGGSPSKPNGYPGWMGRIHINVVNPTATFYHSYFEGTGIHTGTGGGGSYELYLFAEDWVGMAKDKMWEMLQK